MNTAINTLHAIFLSTRIQITLLLLITIVSFGNILQNGFAWDDSDFFEYWYTIKDGRSVSAIFSLPDLLAGDLPDAHRGVYRPVRSVYYLFSYKLYGNNAFFYHFQAIIVHILIVILIYFTINLILKKKYAGFIGAALFAAHPVHTEAISYTTASMDTLGILFFFASFYFYIRARAIKDQQKLTIFLSSVLALLAFFTYEMTLVLPVLVVFYELTFLKFKWMRWKSYLFFLPYFLILGFYVFVRFFWLQIGNRADYLGQMFLVASNQAKISVPEFYLLYLKLLILPLNLTVSHSLPSGLLNSFFQFMFYLDPSGNLLGKLTPVAFLFPVLFVLTIIGAAFLLFRKLKVVFFSVCWFMVSLLTVSNILPQGASFAERYLYIASFSLSLIAGYLSAEAMKLKLGNYFKKIFRFSLLLFFILLMGFYITATAKRNTDWRDEETIMVRAVQSNPTSFVANGALGIVKLKKGEYDESIRLFNKAIQNDPFVFNTKLYLGTAYQKKGDYNRAIQEFQEAIDLAPNKFTGYMFIAGAYSEKGDYQLAVDSYKKSLELNTNDPLIYFNLGVAYMKLGRHEEALDSYQKALKIRPEYTNALMNIGYIYKQQDKLEQAIKFYKMAQESNDREIKAYFALAEIYEQQGDNIKAEESYNSVLVKDNNNELAKSRLKELEHK